MASKLHITWDLIGCPLCSCTSKWVQLLTTSLTSSSLIIYIYIFIHIYILFLFSYSCPHFPPCCSSLAHPTLAPKDNPHPTVLVFNLSFSSSYQRLFNISCNTGLVIMDMYFLFGWFWPMLSFSVLGFCWTDQVSFFYYILSTLLVLLLLC